MIHPQRKLHRWLWLLLTPLLLAAVVHFGDPQRTAQPTNAPGATVSTGKGALP